MNYFTNVKLAYVNVGYYDKDTKLLEAKVDGRLNFNDVPKGFAMYQSLTTVLALGLRVTAWVLLMK